MSKKMRVFLLVCGIMVGAGIIFGIMGAVAGGIGNLEKIEEKVPWISFGPARMEARSFETGAFASIDVSSDIADVSLVPGSSYGVEAVYDEDGGAPVVEVKNKTLVIKPPESREKNVWFNFSNAGSEDPQIKIYFPQDAKFQTVKVSSNMGDVNVSGLSAGDAELTVDSGDLQMGRLTADTLRIESNMGDTEGAHLKTNSADISSSSGDLELSGSFAGLTNIRSDMGDCEVYTQLAKESYAIEAKTGMGDCEVDGMESDGDYHLQNPSAKNRLMLDIEAGDLEIHFQ